MSNSANEMLIVAGMDIGNGYVKGRIGMYGKQATPVDIPAGVSVTTQYDNHDVKAAGVADEVASIFDRMDVKFDTPIIKESRRCYFGQRAINFGKNMSEFDISGHETKAHQELSPMLILGCIAGKALQEYYETYKALPTDILNVTAVAAMALPITEYKDYRREYEDEFKNTEHFVSIYNFEQPDVVRVRIRFAQCVVFAEGAAAQYAIAPLGEKFMERMLYDTRSMGIPLEGITAADILNAQNTVGIDIGEGTVNFPVFTNGKFNPDASRSFNKGYGSVLSEALDHMNGKYPFDSRKALADYLTTTPSNIKRAMYNNVSRIVNDAIEPFVNDITAEFSKILRVTGAYTEVIYIYGGGAAPVRDALYPKLVEVSKKFSGGGDDAAYPIIYMDSRFSRLLNREGLGIIAEKTAESIFGAVAVG